MRVFSLSIPTSSIHLVDEDQATNNPMSPHRISPTPANSPSPPACTPPSTTPPASASVTGSVEDKPYSITEGSFSDDAATLNGRYRVLSCTGLDEAVELVKGMPNPAGQADEVEIRRVFQLEDATEWMVPPEDLQMVKAMMA